MNATHTTLTLKWLFLGLCLAALACPPATPGQDSSGGRLCLNRRLGLPCTRTGCGCQCPERTRAGRAGMEDVDARLDREVAPYLEGGRAEDLGAGGAEGAEGVAASFGAGAEAAGVQSYMIGDFFGGGASVFFAVPGGNDGQLRLVDATLPLGAGDRRLKVTENNCALPVDRVFLTYNHFHNALEGGAANPLDLDRYVFGIEKTFCDGLWSVEMRLPFASGLDSTQTLSAPAFTEATEFGNLAFIVKRMLWRGQAWSAGAGLGLTLPTAADARIAGPTSLVVENEAVHLLPFLGLQYAPNDRLWMLTFVHADFDANGNSVTFTGPSWAPGVTRGVLQDQNLLHFDASWGYWLYRDPEGSRLLSGFAPVIELHYSTTMQAGDYVVSNANRTNGAVGAFTLQDGTIVGLRQDTLDLTGALRFQIGRRSLLTLAGVAPLRTGDDKPFDAEFTAQFIWMY